MMAVIVEKNQVNLTIEGTENGITVEENEIILTVEEKEPLRIIIETGQKGDAGTAATIAVGTVTPLPAGSLPTVTNSGTENAAVFDFGFPVGGGGGGSEAVWGAISGDLENQTDLRSALDEKLNTDDLGGLGALDSLDYNSPYLTNKPRLGVLADHDTVDYQTEVTNKPTLGALADHDTVDYRTEVTNKPTLGALASQDTVNLASGVSGVLSTDKGGTGQKSIIAMKDAFELWWKAGQSFTVASGAGSYTGFLANATTVRFVMTLTKPVKSGVTAKLTGKIGLRVAGNASRQDITISSAVTGTITQTGIAFDVTSSSITGTANSVCAVGSMGLTVTFS